MYFLRKRKIPVLEVHYPNTREETMDVINQINTFLDQLQEKTGKEVNEPTEENVQEVAGKTANKPKKRSEE
jgi:ABC-type hemin transport system substrate-binding protein